MNKLPLAAPHSRVALPQNMNDALALVRAGKLQEASDLLMGGQLAGTSVESSSKEALPGHAAAGLGTWMSDGLARFGQAFDGLDAMTPTGFGSDARPWSPAASNANAADKPAAPGDMKRVAFQHAGADLPYWLYEPQTAAPAQGRPLVLMLHGCTQDAQDFARGTRMNTEAEAAGALVLYPTQAHSANANGCWNWFRPQDQQAGSGEPAALMAMVKSVMASHGVDANRVYVAGLSAGGAMAAVMAQQYPQVFAAVGVHSGLVPGAASNMMGALSAMNSGAKGWAAAQVGGASAVPLIVMHGDADATVHPRNGEQLLESVEASVPANAQMQVQDTGTTPDGQRYTRTTVQNSASSPPSVLAEHWLLHGAGHAWSGGDGKGSHATSSGVNASAEMLRFFLAHPRQGGNAQA